MAVARMCRVEIVGYQPVLADVLDALQRVGVVQIEASPEELATSALHPDDERLRQLEEDAADAHFVRDFLGRYHVPTQPFSTFVSEKFHVSLDEFARLETSDELRHIYRECDDIADRIAAGKREKAQLEGLVRDLEPWLGVHLQISRWKGTEHVALMTGTVPSQGAERIRAMLREASPLASVAEYGGVGLRQAWIVFAHLSQFETIRAALAATQFVEVAFPDLADYPAEESAHAKARIAEIEAAISAAEIAAKELSDEHYARAVTITEAVDGERIAAHVLERVGRTERAFTITGWVRASRGEELRAALAPWHESLDVETRDPLDDENPPVELDNPRFLRPFEALTDLYGRPSYRELDPTPLLAPFFLLFFAICISDVGYGAMLIVGSWLIKTKLDVAPGVKRFLDLMMIGGAGAMAVGVLFASYFALPVESLPSFLRSLQVLDPLAQLPAFLLVTIGLGVVQVFFGVAVSAYDSFRRGDPGTAVFEQVSTIFFFAMMAVCGLGYAAGNATLGLAALVVGLLGTMLMQGRTFEAAINGKDRPAWDRWAGRLWLLAMVAWTVSLAAGGPGWALWAFLGLTLVGLFASRAVRSCVVSFLGGAYAVYGMSSFIGDILSYARLAALGLSGALVGMVFNVLAKMVWDPVGGLWAGGGAGWVLAVVAIVAAAAILVVGHVFNVVINLLGAFVHPARLQFVEFFSKFYEGGGRPLAPLRFATRSVVLSAGESGLKEGA
jgi:V/A-type H+/Na+-transporting ATPase subunit I